MNALTRHAFTTGLLAFSTGTSSLADTSAADRFRRIGKNLICCCGCGDGLLNCNHVGCQDDARMIRELHQQIALIPHDRDVLQWFAAKYGATVLAAPLRGGFDRVAWIAPPTVALTAFGGVVMLLLRWTTPRTETILPVHVPVAPNALTLRIRSETEY